MLLNPEDLVTFTEEIINETDYERHVSIIEMKWDGCGGK